MIRCLVRHRCMIRHLSPNAIRHLLDNFLSSDPGDFLG